jgi:hypothetical protein
VATLIQFSRNIRKLGSRIENNSLILTKRIAKRTLISLVEGTPVDEGNARSNWRVSLGNPTRSIIPAYSPGKKLGIGERQNARATIQNGIAIINQLRVGLKRGTGQAGTALFITNSIPYLGRLRNGYSSQQPNDWVEVALIQAQAEISQTRLLDRNLSEE